MLINANALLLAGPIGAGKTTVADYIATEHKFEHLSFVDKIFLPILRERGRDASRANLQDLGEELRERHGLAGIGHMILPWVKHGGGYVIDDVRSPVVTQYLSRRISRVKVAFIKTSFEDRYPRLVMRDGVASREEQKAAETRSTELSISDLEEVADHTLVNTGEPADLYAQVDSMLWTFGWRGTS